MSKEVKYSWLSAKRNPEMVKDFFIKKLKELRDSLAYEERTTNDLKLEFRAKQCNTSIITINTDGESVKTIEVKLKDIITAKTSYPSYSLIETGYPVLINLLDKYKSKVGHYNSCKERLEKTQKDYDYFMRRYYRAGTYQK
jgi:hypothetical protein